MFLVFYCNESGYSFSRSGRTSVIDWIIRFGYCICWINDSTCRTGKSGLITNRRSWSRWIDSSTWRICRL